MAIKIIRKGKRNFKVECHQCTALLSYDIHDIVGGSIRCPCCGEYCQHYNRIREDSEDTE